MGARWLRSVFGVNPLSVAFIVLLMVYRVLFNRPRPASVSGGGRPGLKLTLTLSAGGRGWQRLAEADNAAYNGYSWSVNMGCVQGRHV
jgi:hypothetical protein